MAKPKKRYSLQDGLACICVECPEKRVGSMPWFKSLVVDLRLWLIQEGINTVVRLGGDPKCFTGVFTSKDAEKIRIWLEEHGAKRIEANEMVYRH